jgi:DNA-directed RNA polymerase I subunit RPA43
MLAHSNIQFLTKTATIKGDCPFAICEVAFEATVWSPQIGMSLGQSSRVINLPSKADTESDSVGRINLCSPDHVSLLVHRTFNVSIPRHHMPTDHWEFEYGPAENDPEFAPDSDEAAEVGGEEANGHGGGKWMHKITGDRLGGPDGFLTFTIIGCACVHAPSSLVLVCSRLEID